jgi:putative membrane protein
MMTYISTPRGLVSYSEHVRTAVDKDFLHAAGTGGQNEIAASQLALERSQTSGVREFAQRMIADHTRGGNRLMRIAMSKGMTAPVNPDLHGIMMVERLRQASGGDFDMMYIQMAGVQAHQLMETLYNNQATNGTDPDLKAFASETLPLVRAHLQMAQQMAGGGGMTGGSMTGGNMAGGEMMNGNMNANMNMNGNMNTNRRNNRNGNRNTNGNMNSNMNMNR